MDRNTEKLIEIAVIVLQQILRQYEASQITHEQLVLHSGLKCRFISEHLDDLDGEKRLKAEAVLKAAACRLTG